jgi:hypothetical protein
VNYSEAVTLNNCIDKRYLIITTGFKIYNSTIIAHSFYINGMWQIKSLLIDTSKVYNTVFRVRRSGNNQQIHYY